VITIPTTELIGGLNDVLPIITDPKSSLAGVVIEWTGEKLVFTVYDVYSGGSVEWVPGEGAEGDIDEDDEGTLYVEWGGDDSPWRTWIWLAQAKDILKLFTLPAKLWRFPVNIKCSPTGDRLIFEREDGPTAERLLTVPADPDKARKEIPDMAAIALAMDRVPADYAVARFNHQRLGAFGAVRPHGMMNMEFGGLNDPVGVLIGSRYRGFIHFTGAKHVRPFSFLRDGSGFAAGQAGSGKSKPDLNVY
jgi:hypothetical protein